VLVTTTVEPAGQSFTVAWHLVTVTKEVVRTVEVTRLTEPVLERVAEPVGLPVDEAEVGAKAQMAWFLNSTTLSRTESLLLATNSCRR
jgi:hypothetical protein